MVSRLTIEMTLNANTAQRFKETAVRLANMNLGEDGLLAVAVLLRIADNYERAAKASGSSEQRNSIRADNARQGAHAGPDLAQE